MSKMIQQPMPDATPAPAAASARCSRSLSVRRAALTLLMTAFVVLAGERAGLAQESPPPGEATAGATGEAGDATPPPPAQSAEEIKRDALEVGLDPTVADGVPDMAYVVADVATGKVLAHHHASERRYPASTTKLMTAYLALRALRSETMALDSPVVMTRAAAREAPAKMGFEPGSVMRLDQALRMMLVKSANDVAYAVGQALGGGSIDRFVAMMNETAAELGMADTHFVNPNGLPQPGQYASPKDMAILGRHVRREFPAFADLFSTEAIVAGGREMDNGNKLLGQFDGADGMKTGYICASGFNLVSSATRDGRTIIAVVYGANGTRQRERLSAALLEEGFMTDPASVDTTLESLPDSGGAPVDISSYICSQRGRTDRANRRVADRENELTFGSPFLHDMGREPATVPVHLGGARARGDIPAAVSLIPDYGIPLPTPRPEPPQPVVSLEGEGEAPSADDAASATGEAATGQTSQARTAPADATAPPPDNLETDSSEPAAGPRSVPGAVPAPDDRPLSGASSPGEASPSVAPAAQGDGKTGRLGIYLDGAAMRPAASTMPEKRP